MKKIQVLKVNWIRMSSGETLARLRAEKSAPKGDVWWGGTTDPIQLQQRRTYRKLINLQTMMKLISDSETL